MSRLTEMIYNLSSGKEGLNKLIETLEKNKNFSIIYDAFVETQVNFEGLIQSPEEFKNLVTQSIRDTIKKIYGTNKSLNEDERNELKTYNAFKRMLSISKENRDKSILYKHQYDDFEYVVRDVYSTEIIEDKPSTIYVSLYCTETNLNITIPLWMFLKDYERKSS